MEGMVFGMLDASMDPMLQIDDRGIIQLVNEAAVRQFGYQRDEFLGNNISMIVGGGHAANHDEYLQRYLETGVAHVIGKKRELSARRKDGTEFPIELGLAEFQHQGERRFCGFVRDLTSQKQAEQELQRRQALVVGMLDASVDPVLQIDECGIIQLVNEAAVRQFGYQKDEFLGKNISMIVGGGHAPNHDEYLRRYLETGVTHVIGKKRELSARRKDGTEFPIELGLADINHEGDRRFCGFIRDMTRQKQDEQELIRREKFTNSIIEAAHDALFVTDGLENIIRVNAASTKVFGWSREELQNMTLYELLAPDFAAQQREELDQYIRDATPLTEKREVTGLRKDGTIFPLLLGCSDVEGPTGKKLFALFSLDISDQKRMIQIEIEKHAAEVLLKNVLPDQIADELKINPTHIAEHHDSATILFGDIVGFTAMSSKMEPTELVRLLNELFILFDELVDKYDLNKIKTIGDCYMVSSVPLVEHDENECTRVCHFALDMFDALARFNLKNLEHQLNLRVGINEGPVVAGVVGTKRFAYDLWGDTVNLASRMESTGVPGKIQVTKAVVDLAGDSFEFWSRGRVQVKGKGEMEAFVLGKRTKKACFSASSLARQEQLQLEHKMEPANIRDHHLRSSIEGITKSLRASNLKEFQDE